MASPHGQNRISTPGTGTSPDAREFNGGINPGVRHSEPNRGSHEERDAGPDDHQHPEEHIAP